MYFKDPLIMFLEHEIKKSHSAIQATKFAKTICAGSIAISAATLTYNAICDYQDIFWTVVHTSIIGVSVFGYALNEHAKRKNEKKIQKIETDIAFLKSDKMNKPVIDITPQQKQR